MCEDFKIPLRTLSYTPAHKILVTFPTYLVNAFIVVDEVNYIKTHHHALTDTWNSIQKKQ